MNQEIECPICLETLRKPIRILSCGHTFCEECLVEFRKDSLLAVRCPTCRQQTLLGPEGVKSFPRNWIVENLIDQQSTNNGDNDEAISGKTDKKMKITKEELLKLIKLASKYNK